MSFLTFQDIDQDGNVQVCVIKCFVFKNQYLLQPIIATYLIPYFISNCKELWASLSATGVVLDEDKVGQLLENHKQQLLSGVLCFKKSKTDKPAKAPAGEAKTIKILVELISDTIVSFLYDCLYFFINYVIS